MNGENLFKNINPFKISFTLLIFTFCFSNVTQAHSININSGYEFGLQPLGTQTRTKTNKSLLPLCEDLESLEIAPGLSANDGYCIGNIAPEISNVYSKEVKIFSQYVDKNGYLVRVIQRNPLLVSLAQFITICRPLGGFLDSSGIYCEYRVEF